MAKIDIKIEKPFDVDASVEAAWDYLCQTQKTIAHYPKLESLSAIGEHQWLWKLEKIGIRNFSHQIVYAVQYHFDEAENRIGWEPLKEHGNSIIRGAFDISETDTGCRVVLSTTGKLDIPVPTLLKSMAAPFVEKEFNSHIEQFAQNLQRAIA
ncbi:SRPBCC family protein [Spongiibacter sp. KMU-158]|uniref:SRPBCC family protein n=1 Tax=Spongiibacter pelagi TaxID=2760804 RepID=A0A927C4Q0_9GAMM|nr:SRPBCC family protein [Spongiibacter pelagi]MBD2859541.1 SRPBCC family protein [Spongiibacter pelagi]